MVAVTADPAPATERALGVALAGCIVGPSLAGGALEEDVVAWAALLPAALAVLSLALALWWRRGHAVALPDARPLIAVAALVVLAAASMATAQNGLVAEVRLRSLLAVVALFVAALVTFPAPRAAQGLSAVVVGTGGLVALAALASLSWPAGPPGTWPGLTAPLTSHNHLAALLGLALPLAFALRLGAAEADDVSWQPCVDGALAAVVGLHVITLSRGGWLALAAGLAVVVAGAVPRGRGALARNLLAAGAAAALLTAALVGPAHVAGRVGDVARLGLEEATGGRFDLWRAALAMARDQPVFGQGLGHFGLAWRSFGRAPAVTDTRYAHNDYLQALAELGVPGLLGVALVAGAVFIPPWQELLNGPGRYSDTATAWARLGALGGLTAAAVHASVEYVFHVPAVALLAAATAALLLGGAPARPPAGLPLLAACVGMAALAAGNDVARTWRVERLTSAGEVLAERREWQDAARCFEHALALEGRSTRAWLGLGKYHAAVATESAGGDAARAHLSAATAAYRRAAELDPWLAEARAGLARVTAVLP